MIASKRGDAGAVNLLLEYGANPNTKTVCNLEKIPKASLIEKKLTLIKFAMRRTALHYACENGHIDCVRSLVKFSADIDSIDSLRLSPLDIAYLLDHKGYDRKKELLTF